MWLQPCLCWTINWLYFQIHGLGSGESLIIIFIDWDWEAREQKLYFPTFTPKERRSEVNDTSWYFWAQFSPRISLQDGCHWAREREWGAISKIFPQCSILRLISASRQTGRKGGPGGSLTFLGLLTFFTDHGWVGGFWRISWSVDNDRDGRGRVVLVVGSC